MAAVQLDLRGLEPASAPLPGDVAEVSGADAVVVRGPVPALAGVLAALHKAERAGTVPVAWEPADDDDSRGLARDLRIGSGLEREVGLVVDDHGGVLLHRGRIEPPTDDPRHAIGSRLFARMTPGHFDLLLLSIRLGTGATSVVLGLSSI